jgi:murein DD-endopeptidase MepM/ murein hydrolase activator NlpD
LRGEQARAAASLKVNAPHRIARDDVLARVLPDLPTGAYVGGANLVPLTGESPEPTALPPDESGRWIWPVRGELSQLFSDRHRAIDIVSDHGALVVAADAGKVVYSDWEITGYGYLLIVDHGDGYRTYYAHLYGFYVDVGERVERGDLLGQLGTTGYSTGPHLHFEIRYQGIQRDPLELLPQR